MSSDAMNSSLEQHQTQQQDPPTPIISNQSSPVSAMGILDLNGPPLPLVVGDINKLSKGVSSSQTPRFSCPDEEPIIVQRSSLWPKESLPQQQGVVPQTSNKKESIHQKKSRKNSNNNGIVSKKRQPFPDWNVLAWMLSDFVRSGLSFGFFRDRLRQLLKGRLFQNTMLLGSHNLSYAPISPPSSFTLSERRRRRRKQQGLPQHIQGLPNQGQSCFLNSVLQALASLNPFLTYLDDIVRCQEEMKEAGIAATADPLHLTSGTTSFCRQLLDILDDINDLEGEEDEDTDGNDDDVDTRQYAHKKRASTRSSWRRHKSMNPKPLLKMIGESSAQFKSKPFTSMEQQDAQELLSALLGAVVDDAHIDALLDRRFTHSPESSRENSFKPTIHAFQPLGESAERSTAMEKHEDDLMTSALASSFFKEEQLQQSSSDAIDLSGGSAGLVMEESNSVLSLSGFLLLVESEQQRNTAEVNGDSVDTLAAVKPSLCIQQEKQFQEEKKQDHCDTVEGRGPTLNPALLSTPPASSVRHPISAITPSPLSGWLGSTVQCAKCEHVRPIQNAPFLEIPLVPVSVPSYIARVYCSPSQATAPNSRSIPPCSLGDCLAEFTSVEMVKDVECKSCTIEREREHLEEEAMMLRGAIETMTKRMEKRPTSNENSLKVNAPTNDTKYLRDDLHQVEMKLLRLNTMDPDDDDLSGVLRDNETQQLLDPEDKPNAPIERGIARKCLLLTRPPSILCCHIQRRYFDPFTNRMEKCLQHVDFPEVLDLSPYCAYGSMAKTPWAAGSNLNKSHGSSASFAGKQNTMLYRLQSVIEHRGNAYGGHYVAYRRDQVGQWFLISDESVRPVFWRDVRFCQAYLLFYESI